MKIAIGDNAPSFSLYDSEKKLTDLEDFLGQNVLILFIPAAFTSTCLKEFCSIRDNISVYNTLACKVLGISTDSVYTLAKWKEEQKFNFTLLSDFNKEICEFYGAQYDVFNYGMKGVARRAAFIIDKEGKIRYAEVLESASALPDFEKIKNTLAELA